MLPFVVAGGIILGIGFLIDFAAGNGNVPGMTGATFDYWFNNIYDKSKVDILAEWTNWWMGNFGTHSEVAGWFSAIGKTGMMMMVPVLAAYISYTIVGPQGLMPGFIAGILADGTGGFAYASKPGGWSGLWSVLFPLNENGETIIPMQSGFIGGMVGAYVAALIVFGLTLGFKNLKIFPWSKRYSSNSCIITFRYFFSDVCFKYSFRLYNVWSTTILKITSWS